MVDAHAVHKVSSNVYTYMVNDQQDLFLLFSKTYSFNATEVKEGRWANVWDAIVSYARDLFSFLWISFFLQPIRLVIFGL